MTKGFISKNPEEDIDLNEYNSRITEIFEQFGFSEDYYATIKDKPNTIFQKAIAMADLESAKPETKKPKDNLFSQVIQVISRSTQVTWESVRRTAVQLINQLKR